MSNLSIDYFNTLNSNTESFCIFVENDYCAFLFSDKCDTMKDVISNALISINNIIINYGINYGKYNLSNLCNLGNLEQNKISFKRYSLTYKTNNIYCTFTITNYNFDYSCYANIALLWFEYITNVINIFSNKNNFSKLDLKNEYVYDYIISAKYDWSEIRHNQTNINYIQYILCVQFKTYEGTYIDDPHVIDLYNYNQSNSLIYNHLYKLISWRNKFEQGKLPSINIYKKNKSTYNNAYNNIYNKIIIFKYIFIPKLLYNIIKLYPHDQNYSSFNSTYHGIINLFDYYDIKYLVNFNNKKLPNNINFIINYSNIIEYLYILTNFIYGNFIPNELIYIIIFFIYN